MTPLLQVTVRLLRSELRRDNHLHLRATIPYIYHPWDTIIHLSSVQHMVCSEHVLFSFNCNQYVFNFCLLPNLFLSLHIVMNIIFSILLLVLLCFCFRFFVRFSNQITLSISPNVFPNIIFVQRNTISYENTALNMLPLYIILQKAE